MNPLNTDILSQRIGEIIILDQTGEAKIPFINALCSEVKITDHDIVIGRLSVNENLILYLYGVSQPFDFQWELVAPKALGQILLFNWQDEVSFQQCQKILAFMSARYDLPFIIAADVGSGSYPVPEHIFKPNISLSQNSKFTFFSRSRKASMRKVAISLVDLLIEKSI